MTEIMQMVIDRLGVKEDEVFSLSDSPEGVFCFIGSGQLAVVTGGIAYIEAKPEVLIDLLNGKSKIVKLPFKPKEYDYYSYVDKNGKTVTEEWWDLDQDYYRFNARNCFRPEEEITPEDKKRIVAEIKSKYESE